ncbi:hypothetical protein JT359_11355 [Candidatus Poribacteria bacterium]|nr:hypothetical protein [Candidatus Poribacteria bacterium]
MGEISRIKSAAPSSTKPLVPWGVVASTFIVVLLMFGFGNHQYLPRFQKPYSLDANAEMSIEIVDIPIVANLESKLGIQSQVRNVKTQDKDNNSDMQINDVTPAIAETQTDEISEDYTKWELPKAAKARLGKGAVDVMQFSPDGKLLAIGSSIGVWLYDVKTGKEISIFPGSCQSLAFSPDGRFLANGGGGDVGGSGRYHGEEVQLWEVSTGKRVPIAKSPSPAIALLFSEDGKTLISLGDWGDTISVFNIETGELNQRTFRERPKDRAYAESYALIHNKLAIGGVSGKVQLWDPISGNKLPIHREHSDGVEQGNVLGETSFEMGRDEQILGLAVSPDGSQIAIGSENGTVLLWDTAEKNKSIILREHTDKGNPLDILFQGIRSLAFSPNGKMLASEDTNNTVKLWDTDTGTLLATLTGHIDQIMALTFSPEGNTLASASTDGTVRFWDTETNKPLPIHISEHIPTQRGMAIIEDNNTLASVAYNGIFTFWDLKTQRKIGQQTEWHSDFLWSAAFSSDGTKLAIPQQQLIHLTDVRTGREIEQLKVTEDRIGSAMSVSPDGKTVAFDSSTEICLWNIDTGEILNIPLNMPLIMPLKDRAVPTVAIQTTITSMIFSQDGKKLVSGDSQGNVQIWDAKTGDELANFLTGDEIEEPMDNGIHSMFFSKKRITALAFSADAALLAVGTYGQIQVYRTEKKTQIMEMSNIPCNALVFAPDETVLVVGLASGGIQLLDISTGETLATLDGHTAPIVQLLFSSDGKTLVSTGYDGTILVWDWDKVLKKKQKV